MVGPHSIIDNSIIKVNDKIGRPSPLLNGARCNPLVNDLLILLALLIILVELYRKVRQTWLRMLLSQKKKGKGAAKTSRAALEERARLPLLSGR